MFCECPNCSQFQPEREKCGHQWIVSCNECYSKMKSLFGSKPPSTAWCSCFDRWDMFGIEHKPGCRNAKPDPANDDAVEEKIDDIVYDFVVKDRDPYSAVGFKKKILELLELARGGK